MYPSLIKSGQQFIVLMLGCARFHSQFCLHGITESASTLAVANKWRSNPKVEAGGVVGLTANINSVAIRNPSVINLARSERGHHLRWPGQSRATTGKWQKRLLLSCTTGKSHFLNPLPHLWIGRRAGRLTSAKTNQIDREQLAISRPLQPLPSRAEPTARVSTRHEKSDNTPPRKWDVGTRSLSQAIV